MRPFSETFYIGESLIFGHIGELLIITSFITALFSFGIGITYFSQKQKNEVLKNTAITFFKIHAYSIFLVFSLLIFLFYTQKYEYHYVWRHSSNDLPWYFILSALWEGQEGSFLLWMFWHSVLGLWLLRSKNELQIGVLSVLALIQAMLATMIVGWQIGDLTIGSNPFILLRNELNIPLLAKSNYLELLKDGNGLNILLQNYWMVIHPPVLFLGFASVSIPFGYAFSSLLSRRFDQWTQSVMPWALFSIGALGAGILMGGKWAYEALSFGGFWAWDPVENASLVPWLILVAGVHTNMIYNATKHSLKATYLFYILAFAFILYSTFLTRSGILGDSSVHSFTDLGMTGQLLVFIALFLIPSFFILAFYWSRLPDNKEEEKTNSREFWIFIGTLFIAVSAIQITFSTSIPVWNKVFGTQMAPPINANDHYNSIQIWFSILVVFLMGFTPFLKYRSQKISAIIKTQGILWLLSVLLATLSIHFSEIPFFQQYKVGLKFQNFRIWLFSGYFLLAISSFYGLIGSIWYMYQSKYYQKWKLWGGSIAHFGFVLLILGALISQYQKKAISFNTRGIDFGKEFDDEEQTSNVLLIKGQQEKLTDYSLRYTDQKPTKKGAIFSVLFKDLKNQDSFFVYPEAMYIKEGENMRLNAEPSIKKFWNKDIFTHVSSVPSQDKDDATKNERPAKLNDTIFTTREMLVFNEVNVTPKNNEILDVKASLIRKKENSNDEIIPVDFELNTKSGQIKNPEITSKDGELKIAIARIEPSKQEFVFKIKEKNPLNEWIIMKAIEFPGINLLWLGCMLLVFGSLMSAYFKRKNANS